jgi:cardiolipin synthase
VTALSRFIAPLWVAAALAGCAGLSDASAASSHAARVVARARGADSAQLSLITEPQDGMAPFYAAINRARSSVDLVMYELDDPTAERDLVAAQQRGVTVRVLLNRGYYGGGSPENAAAYSYLHGHGVPVRWSPGYFALTHQKTMVIDARTAYIMTLNFVADDYATSRDFAVTDSDPADVRAITTTFGADWDGQRITAPSGADLVWSPGALAPQLRLIDTARRSLDIYNEEMDDPQITGALIAAAHRGVDVKVVMTAGSEWDGAFAELAAAGVHVRTFAADASLYIHAKAILADGRTLFLGSENFSAGSLLRNRELGLITTAPAIIHSLAGTFERDDAQASAYSGSGSAPTGSGSGGESGSGAAGTCTVHATYSSSYDDWDVYVDGAPADSTATARAGAYTASYRTDASGYADIYLKAPVSAAGTALTVTAGPDTCSGTL